MEFRSQPGRFAEANAHIAGMLARHGQLVDTGHWQSMEEVPQTATRELMNVTLTYGMPDTKAVLAVDVNPNLPWADLHFDERVGGVPTNPGDTYHLWPYYRGNVPRHQGEGDQFSHTYMERFWPRLANLDTGEAKPGLLHLGHTGIRYRYGDLNDVMDLLVKYPFTRQAFLPIFFPEDTGAHAGERVPCTLGYHFIRRANKLHVVYPIRSCDFLRHFRDDVYLAARLVQWVLDYMEREEAEGWTSVTPGLLTMHMTSLHVFQSELPILRRMSGLVESDDDAYAGAV